MAKQKDTETKEKKKKSTPAELRKSMYEKFNVAVQKEAKSLKVSVSTEALMAERQGRNGATPTSAMCADLIMGGGFPKQRVTIVSGMSGGGKTTLMQSGLANQLRLGGMAHYADFEGAADGAWIKSGTGIDLSQYEGSKTVPQTFFPLFDFPHGKSFFQYMMRLMQQSAEMGLSELPGLAHLFTLDSIPALPAEALLENDDSGSKPWVALLLSEFLPQVRAWMRQSNSSLVAVNQIRLKIRTAPHENPEYEPGGNAPVFYSDLRLRIDGVKPKHASNPNAKDHRLTTKLAGTFDVKANGQWLETNPDGSVDQYVYRRLHTLKNRVFSPMKTTYMRICILKGDRGEGTGIDRVFDTLNFFEEMGRLKWGGPTTILLDGKKYDYFDLKKQIEEHSDLSDECASLLDSGKAFSDYLNRLGGQIGKPDPELEEEDSEESEDTEE